MFLKKVLTMFAVINLAFMPMHVMAGNKKAEEQEEKAVTESTILLIASAYSGIALVTECQLFSTVIFAAGALYYVYAEIKNWNNFKESSDMVVERYRKLNKEQTEAQVDALSKAEEATKEAENAARERAGSAEAVGTIFMVAAIMSIVEFILNKIYGSPPDSCRIEKNAPDFLKPILNTLIPESFAQADANQARAMGILSPESVAKLSSALYGMTEIMETVKTNGIVRAVVFGAYSLIAFQVAKMTEKAADIYKDQAAQYRKLLNKLVESLSKIGYIEYQKTVLANGELRKLDEQFLKENKRNCARTGARGSFLLNQNCSCRKNNSCNKVSMPSIGYQGFNVPDAVTGSISSFSTMANNDYASNNGEADLAQTSLNQNANRVRFFKRDLEDAANQSQARNKRPQINFREQESLMADKIRKIIKGGLTADGKALLASDLGISINPETRNEAKKKEDTIDLKRQLRSLSTPLKIKSSKGKSGDPLADFLLQGEDNNQVALDAGTELAKFKDNDEEIEKDKKKSIFKIITNRYIKSAFPILFEEK